MKAFPSHSGNLWGAAGGHRTPVSAIRLTHPFSHHLSTPRYWKRNGQVYISRVIGHRPLASASLQACDLRLCVRRAPPPPYEIRHSGQSAEWFSVGLPSLNTAATEVGEPMDALERAIPKELSCSQKLLLGVATVEGVAVPLVLTEHTFD